VRILLLSGLTLVLLAGLGVLYVRFAGSDPARWHLDPETATRSARPNHFSLLPPDAPVFGVSAERLAGIFDDFALSQPNVQRLAGQPDTLLVTYVQRSALIGFPDYISVKFLDTGNGTSTLAIFSRSRFGYSDGGVNARRVLRWLGALQGLVGG
jgi:uncharacterized protein (DUF1499 family)